MLKRKYLGQEAEEAWPKRQESVWKQKEIGELGQAMREDGSSEVRMQSWSQWSDQLRATEAAWAVGAPGNWWFGVISLALVRGMNWRLKGMIKGNFIWCICGCKTKGQPILQFWGSYEIRNDPGYTQKHELVCFDTVQPNFRSCPHPETPTPDIQFMNPQGNGYEATFERGML